MRIKDISVIGAASGRMGRGTVEQCIHRLNNISSVFRALLDECSGVQLCFAAPVIDRKHRHAFAHVSSHFVQHLRQCNFPLLPCHFLHSVLDINDIVTHKGECMLKLQ